MKTIQVEHHPDPARLETLGISGWPIWTKESSHFPWFYDEPEICYFLEGDVTVIPDGGEPVHMGRGDLVTFPAGLSCTWTIHQSVKKHYRSG